MKNPNFIYIGPPKTGSKWITKVLLSHPEIYVSGIDMYFFDRNENFAKGYSWYKNFFKGASAKHLAVGELSHDYIYSSDAAKRIHDFDKNMKIIINLRNPVDLCFSVYKAMIKYGEISMPFADAMINKEKTHGIELMEYGKYYENITNYTELFDNENILFLNYDNLVVDKKEFMKQIYDFLEVTDMPELSYVPAYNTAKESRFKILGILAKASANFLRKINLLQALRVLKNSSLLKKILFRKRRENSMNEYDITRFKKYYVEDLKKVEQLTKLDLSNWHS